ncbi:COG3904 family protein [Lysobacter humi (ex Lee et al. 2017)]
MRRLAPLVLALGLVACAQAPAPPPAPTVVLGEDAPPAPARLAAPQPQPTDTLSSTRWPPARVGSGHAEVSCEREDADDAPRVLDALEFFSLVDAMTACQSTGLVRLHYSGRIDEGFSELARRVAAMAERMDLPERVLDLDSAGGIIEEAIEAGDVLAETGWTVRIRESANCHSACVLILAAADDRDIEGDVGVHRLMRDRSTATSRAELNEELRTVNGLVREYFERHGVALAVADLMMTVPNRRLRVLTADELDLYGLQGRNAAQDDLERIVARRKCGEKFVRRRDAFQRQYEQRCLVADADWETSTRCGLELRAAFGFPDARCPAETPLADAARRLQLVEAHRARVAQAAEAGSAVGATSEASATATQAATAP